MSKIEFLFFVFAVMLTCVSCQQNRAHDIDSDSLPPGDPDNGELILPGGFEALVVIEEVGRSRHLVVNDNGDIYVKLRFNPNMNRRGGNVGLRDTDGDGKADIVSYFGDYEDEGGLACCITINDDYLYFSSMRSVFRQKLSPGSLVPDSEIETILTDDHEHGVTHWHNTKPMAFDGEGNMFVPFGTPSDACQDIDEYGPAGIPGGVGLDPCPELEKHGGVWKFDADTQGQTQEDGTLFATGLRSILGLKWNEEYGHLFAVVHGIDNFHRMFPEDFTAWDGAMFPSEIFIRMSGGEDYGWPYAYYDQIQGRNVLQPGYGGDGEIIGRASEFDEPIMGFPGHFAPQDLLFYEGDQFPERYNEGAFVVFHGSGGRPPYPQAGYHVAFIPFEDGLPTGEWEVFADGFAQADTVVNSSDARYRPMGIAEGPGGSLYISDSRQGKIWRVMFKGDKSSFGADQLASMEDRKSVSYLRTPDPIEDNLQAGNNLQGEIRFNTYCAACHQRDGRGDGSRYPPLRGEHWTDGMNDERLIRTILEGRQGGTVVDGVAYSDVMPGFENVLDDLAISSIMTYIKTRFNEGSGAVSQEEVQAVRESLEE